MRYLSHEQARQFYDQFGDNQDTQSFYEDKAIDALLQHGNFQQAQNVLEFGCGTGRLAQILLTKYLPTSAKYRGLDISSTMVNLTTERLQEFSPRIRISQTKGDMKLILRDQIFDRFVSAYVLDLLPDREIRELMQEAYRVLTHSGILAVVSLSQGETTVSKGITSLWRTIHHINPKWVGGCRPLELLNFIDNKHWKVKHHEKISQFGVTSEVLVAEKITRQT